MTEDTARSPTHPPIPAAPGERVRWRSLHGASRALAITAAAADHAGPVVVLTPDTPSAQQLEEEIRFFSPAAADRLLHLPDWETLPYDVFSPHQDIVSERLATLYQLPTMSDGILLVPVTTLMVRLPPRGYLEANALILSTGEQVDRDALRARLDAGGYRCVSQVMEHGEFAVRGSLVDLYPMGSAHPYRIDLLDDEVDTIRTFDPDTQRTRERVSEIRLLPAREFPMSEDGIATFRQNWRARFEGDPTASTIYRDVSEGLAPAGVEYWLPLFFDHSESLFDYVPTGSLFIALEHVHDAAEAFWGEVTERYEQRRHDTERPLLPPGLLFLQGNEVFAALRSHPTVSLGNFEDSTRFATRVPPRLPVDPRGSEPLRFVHDFLADFPGRVLFVAETPGRREVLLQTFRAHGLKPALVDDWAAFVDADIPVAVTVAPLDQGAVLDHPSVAVITESLLFGERAVQSRRRKVARPDAESVIRDLSELNIGAPVVHEHHGVGRYGGLETLTVGGLTSEFLTLTYAGDDKLYVPVASLHLVSRYTGSDAEHAPLHRLGSQQWQKARRKAAQRAFDVAAELLEIHARRAARSGHAFTLSDEQYQAFAGAFPFEETPDQQSAIEDVIRNMTTGQPMDRLVCGDVGFGKTEVAMRAAFIAVQDNRQVAILVPTTLLAQQHYQNFSDRFADWPVRVELLSRFRSRKQQDAAVADLRSGKVDIVIGTHKLLQEGIAFKRLGLVIIDEEHRFGVRQKERLKALRAEVDVLTLTATPIPRTLNMALSSLRDLSIIATPPERRLSIKTFVSQWNGPLIREACLREIRRGGQVYFLHNKVENIERIADQIRELVPEAAVRIAHGQMRERELESVMLDFYHRRFNILLCTTIIETGIDVPSANTIVINRADHFGLAQLHQLRGRVGRSHHRAYAYLLVPDRRAITADAAKRLEAIEALEDLGIGFTLATHDLEIRGAGELLGDEQSGQIHEVGYSLYTELLERAVAALKAGRSPELDRPLDHGAEIDLHLPALIPEDYLPDVHTRLLMYKRIASADGEQKLDELQVEMIDRFGLLPDPARNLFRVTALKLKATPLGVRKVELGEKGGRISFHPNPSIDPGRVIALIQQRPQHYRLDGEDRLRLTMELEEEEARIRTVHDLLDTLGVQNAA